jgi:four helix bundle protein
MTRAGSYRDLVAWQKAMALVVAVYRETASWPADERFGLISQVRRAAVSVPANIAEGSGRSGPAEMRHFLSIAHGSLYEAQTYLDIAESLGFLNPPTARLLLDQCVEISRVINGLKRSLAHS